jgi:hypothetical protein
MRIPIALFFACFALATVQGLTTCNVTHVEMKPAPPSEQEIVRYRAISPASAPTLSGQIKVLDKNETYALSSAIVSLNGKISYADEKGYYRLNLIPGINIFAVGQIGIYQSRLKLQVENGDSVRVNFFLRPDSRPLD